MDDIFTLYSCCQLVKGVNQATICDLQRNRIYRIPLSLYGLFDQFKKINFKGLFEQFQNDADSLDVINEYQHFLNENELGYWGIQPVIFSDLPLKYEDNRIINNCIIDFDESSHHNLVLIANELTELRCEYLELRYFYGAENSLEKIASDLAMFSNSSIRGIEIVKRMTHGQSPFEEFDLLKDSHFRLTKYTVYNANENRKLATEDYSIILTKEMIMDETSCGCVGDYYCVADTNLFIESMNKNNCLNKKISVDKKGNIKNCPSMQKIFGNISQGDSLIPISKSPEFQSVWAIKKDDIEVCRDCELKYVCQDCRAYTVNPENARSKPLKCNYNPYEI